MNLTLLQRIQLTSLIPQKGNYEKLVITEDLRKKIGLTQEEVKDNEVKTLENSMISVKTNPEKELEFTELEKNMIKDGFKELDKKGELNAALLPLYRLFVLE